AETFPVYSFASGPTNSMRGAAFLSKRGISDGHKPSGTRTIDGHGPSRSVDALVIDVGGTTTDIGILRHGFPREANNVVEIGGVRTLFRMPDLLSLGLGGGTVVSNDPLRVGPTSVGFRLTEQA